MKQKSRVPYLWVGTLMMLLLGSIYAWSYFKTALGAIFPMWNQKQLSLTFTIMMILFATGGLLGGKLSKTIRHSMLALLSGCLMLIGFVTVSFLPSGNETLAADPSIYFLRRLYRFGRWDRL